MDIFLSMRIFTQIVELGSFAKAVAAMQLHRPVAMKAVQHLEQTLGVRLLHRTTRRITLSADGEEFCDARRSCRTYRTRSAAFHGMLNNLI